LTKKVKRQLPVKIEVKFGSGSSARSLVYASFIDRNLNHDKILVNKRTGDVIKPGDVLSVKTYVDFYVDEIKSIFLERKALEKVQEDSKIYKEDDYITVKPLYPQNRQGKPSKDVVLPNLSQRYNWLLKSNES